MAKKPRQPDMVVTAILHNDTDVPVYQALQAGHVLVTVTDAEGNELPEKAFTLASEKAFRRQYGTNQNFKIADTTSEITAKTYEKIISDTNTRTAQRSGCRSCGK